TDAKDELRDGRPASRCSGHRAGVPEADRAGALIPGGCGRALRCGGRRLILKCVVAFDRGEGLAVELRVRIDEVVERFAALRWAKAYVAAQAEHDAVLVRRAEEIVLLFGMLPSLRGVQRNPSNSLHVEFGPAVIAGYRAFVRILGQRESDFEARGNACCAGHADEERMKIG